MGIGRKDSSVDDVDARIEGDAQDKVNGKEG